MITLIATDCKVAEETLFTLITIARSALHQELVDNLLELLVQASNTSEKDFRDMEMQSGNITNQNQDTKPLPGFQNSKAKTKKAEDRLRV